MKAMEYAVVRTGGKQYTVKPGDTLLIEKIPGNADDIYRFEEVLLHVVDGKVMIGNPLVSGLAIQGTILGQTKGEKIRVAKFKAKARYRKVTGHRQKLTKVRVETIGGGKVERVEKVDEVEKGGRKTARRTVKTKNK